MSTHERTSSLPVPSSARRNKSLNRAVILGNVVRSIVYHWKACPIKMLSSSFERASTGFGMSKDRGNSSVSKNGEER